MAWWLISLLEFKAFEVVNAFTVPVCPTVRLFAQVVYIASHRCMAMQSVVDLTTFFWKKKRKCAAPVVRHRTILRRPGYSLKRRIGSVLGGAPSTFAEPRLACVLKRGH